MPSLVQALEFLTASQYASHSWRSGLSRCTQVAVYSYAGVRIPLNAHFFAFCSVDSSTYHTIPYPRLPYLLLCFIHSSMSNKDVVCGCCDTIYFHLSPTDENRRHERDRTHSVAEMKTDFAPTLHTNTLCIGSILCMYISIVLSCRIYRFHDSHSIPVDENIFLYCTEFRKDAGCHLRQIFLLHAIVDI